jgi:hypothetical protein
MRDDWGGIIGGITRRLAPEEAFTLDQVEYHTQALTGKRAFFCKPLHASSMTVDACIAQFDRRGSSCIGCAVGCHHSGRSAPREPGRNDAGIAVNVPVEQCVRCGRNGRDEHSHRIFSRFRTVVKASSLLPGASGRTSLCMNDFNRQRECRPDVLRNSKGARPVKHAYLREAVITYRVSGKTHTDVNIGLRSGLPEILRFLDRGYGDGAAKLISVTLGGEPANLKSTDDPAWLADKPREQKPEPKRTTTYTHKVISDKRKPLPLEIATDEWGASNVDDDWRDEQRATAAERPTSSAPFVDWNDWNTPLYHLHKPSDHSEPEPIKHAAASPQSVEKTVDPSSPQREPSAAEKAILNRGVAEHLVDCFVYGKPGDIDEEDAAGPSEPIAEPEQAAVEAAIASEHGDQPDDEPTSTVIDITPASAPSTFLDRGAVAEQPAPRAQTIVRTLPQAMNRAQRRAFEKAQRKQQKAAARLPATKPAPMVSTCRAFVQVLFEVGARK